MLSCLGFDDKETICRVEVFGLEFVNLKLLLPSAWFLKRIEDEKIIFFFPLDLEKCSPIVSKGQVRNFNKNKAS